MNDIIEKVSDCYSEGKLTANKTCDDDISTKQIYDKSIELLNSSETWFSYENEVPACFIQLKENIIKFKNAFGYDEEYKTKLW